VAFIVAHNHPGGNAYPSEADWDITKKLRDGGAVLDITMLDHLIIADEKCISLKEMPRWV
jgi:DNA repair protein RadC